MVVSGKKPALKTFADVQSLLQAGKKRDVKLLIRENAWPINSTVRAQLWPALCSQHQVGKSMLDGFYWDMVNQVRYNPFSIIVFKYFPNTNLLDLFRKTTHLYIHHHKTNIAQQSLSRFGLRIC